MRICTVVGARPQFIKAGPLSAALARQPGFAETIIHTGQHFDDAMSAVFFRELNLPEPAINLGIGGGRQGAMTGEMLARLEAEFERRRPDLVLLYGDTNSTLAGALAASKLRLPIAHVEAGPRMGNHDHPEELNRIVADHAADLRFCPSEAAAGNLAREGLSEGVHVVGDVMYDAVIAHLPHAQPPPLSEPYVLATIHRPQNTDEPRRLATLLHGLGRLARTVLWPVHPRTAAALARFDLELPGNVVRCEPLGYLAMLGALRHAAFVVTDSGGLPKEAFFLGRRSLTVSDETPWPELVAADATRVVGADAEMLMDAVAWASRPPATDQRPFGDGHAAERIVKVLVQWWSGRCQSTRT